MENLSNENSRCCAKMSLKRHFDDWRCLWPRRYVIACMLFIVFIINNWQKANFIFMITHIYIMGKDDATLRYPSIGHFSITDVLKSFEVGFITAALFIMPGSVLLFLFSSHKFILISASLSSILHMIMPIALKNNSICIVFLFIGQHIVSAPLIVAAITMMKDWSPPSERTKLIMFIMHGIFIEATSLAILRFIYPYNVIEESFYICGTAGLIWSLVWYKITADTPQNDRSISKEELRYLENNIPTSQHKIKIKEIPWKAIISSEPVPVLSLIFFKMACSIETIFLSGNMFSSQFMRIDINPLSFFVPFFCSFLAVIPSSAALVDWLLKRFKNKKLLIRKFFLCGGFFLQCIFLIGTLAKSQVQKTVFYMISYLFFAASTSGFFSIALDLSPRYVSIIAGIAFTFYQIGTICFAHFWQALTQDTSAISWVFLLDGILSLLSIICFGIWGDAEEQLWSFQPRNSRDYKNYLIPETEDNSNP